MPAKTPKNLPVLPIATARRLLLGAQGLLDDPRRRVNAAEVGDLIDRMGFVQLDSINIVERAHHLTLASRLDGYRHSHLTRLLEKERRLFEHWTHDASAIPARWLPYWTHRFARRRIRIENNPWWRERLGDEPEKVIAQVRERIAREGPLLSRDFEDAGGGGGSWWGWKPQKAVLEYLWHSGELAVLRRESFHKVYDLTERVFPDLAGQPLPSAEEHVEWACRTAIERLGAGTSGEIAHFWQAVKPEEAAAWCLRAVDQREIVQVELEGNRPTYAVPDWEERAARLPQAPARLRLLSPFDPVIRDRRRALRLFAFDYRFEAFVPEAKRTYGYYVLPILEGERLIGRLDPKFERDRGTLVIRRVWWEERVRPSRGRLAGLEAAVARLARTIGAENFEM